MKYKEQLFTHCQIWKAAKRLVSDVEVAAAAGLNTTGRALSHQTTMKLTRCTTRRHWEAPESETDHHSIDTTSKNSSLAPIKKAADIKKLQGWSLGQVRAIERGKLQCKTLVRDTTGGVPRSGSIERPIRRPFYARRTTVLPRRRLGKSSRTLLERQPIVQLRDYKGGRVLPLNTSRNYAKATTFDGLLAIPIL